MMKKKRTKKTIACLAVMLLLFGAFSVAYAAQSTSISFTKLQNYLSAPDKTKSWAKGTITCNLTASKSGSGTLTLCGGLTGSNDKGGASSSYVAADGKTKAASFTLSTSGSYKPYVSTSRNVIGQDLYLYAGSAYYGQ